jgi:hypothetical protein
MTATSMTLTARTPDDVLAMVPVVLGFVPQESVVMLTFGAPRPFHARVDLARRRSEVPDLVEALLAPARRHRVRRVLLVLYAAEPRPADTVARALVRAFEEAGIEVIEALRADGARWHLALGTRPGMPADGVPYDVSAHPFVAHAVVEGRVTHGSRDELRSTLAGDPVRVGRVVAALALLTGDPPPLEAEAAWAGVLVERHVRDGSCCDDHELARLLRGILEVRVRDATWSGVSRETAREHVRFWTDVVRRSPGPLLAAPAALLAFAAWQAGEGALAWCALDRCAEVDEEYSLARLVAQALLYAVPPDAWDAAREEV